MNFSEPSEYWNDDFSLTKGGKKNTKFKGSRGGGKGKETKTACHKNKNQVYSQKYVRQKVTKLSKSKNK